MGLSRTMEVLVSYCVGEQMCEHNICLYAVCMLTNK